MQTLNLYAIILAMYNMEDKTTGAWLINHTKKLEEVANIQEFEDIELAGKCGIFLSNLAASNEQSDFNNEKVQAIAKVSGIKKAEIDGVKKKLKDFKLIDTGMDGSISILGITTATILNHTASIFSDIEPNNYQRAALEISESVSDFPRNDEYLKEYIADSYGLSKSDISDLFIQSEQIGFIDFEMLDNNSKVYFNGNLFKKSHIEKTSNVLNSLKQEEIIKVNQLDSELTNNGCVTLEKAIQILDEQLLSKLNSIGMYDRNEVSNPQETKTFMTKPSAFSKYGNPFEEDALDLAKAFVSALFYGMNYSSSSRGQITMISWLLKKLILGEEVGPATAIGQDYRLLEYKRVIELRHEKNNMYWMKLLKKDVGELALQVLEVGDATQQTMKGFSISTGSITNYKSPEQTRRVIRKKQANQSKKEAAHILRTLRK